MRRKMIIQFNKSSIVIKEDVNSASVGIPYRFDLQFKYGRVKIKSLFEALGFIVEMKEETK